MALLSPQSMAITGTTVTLGAVSASDTIAPGDRVFLVVSNASGGGLTATVVVPGTTHGQANPDVAVSISNGATKYIGPLVPVLADPATGLITVTFSATSSVTAAVVSI